VIVGCNPLGRLMGRLFQEQGESVVMIDTDTEACQLAEAEGLSVFQSSGLDPEALEEAGIESMGTFLAVTKNGQLNLILAQRALEEFEPPRVYAVFPHNEQNNTNTNKAKVNAAFVEQLPIKDWNLYINQNQVKLGKTVFKEQGFSLQQVHFQALIRAGELIPLLVKRKGNLQVVKMTEDWQIGDEIIYLLHDPRPKLLKRLSGGTQTSRLVLESLPEVEEIPIAEPIAEIS
ncbi:MAG: NAD(P)-binding protein, partial [Microcystaceae cyanobacterium]